jgi:hypothetical protein
MYRKVATFAAVTALAAMVFAGTAVAGSFKGTVVHKNRAAHSFVVAKSGGGLVEVHSSKTPALGRRVVVTGRTLHNGTFYGRSVWVGRQTGHAHIRGVVTYVTGSKSKFVVSAKGVSLVVSTRGLASGKRPAVGEIVTVDGTFDGQGNVEADDCQNDGQNGDFTDLEGQILSIDTVARTLTITADDEGDLIGASIVVIIPDTWDMTVYQVGDMLEIAAITNSDGTYTAVETGQDGNGQEADDQGEQQGDENNYTDVQGQITAIDLVAGTLTVASDEGDGDTPTTMLVYIPVSMDITQFQVGDDVELCATANLDGSFTAVDPALISDTQDD